MIALYQAASNNVSRFFIDASKAASLIRFPAPYDS